MDIIKLGKRNDTYVYAIWFEEDREYYQIHDRDLEYVSPSAKIFYDSGVYTMPLEDIPDYVCYLVSNSIITP